MDCTVKPLSILPRHGATHSEPDSPTSVKFKKPPLPRLAQDNLLQFNPPLGFSSQMTLTHVMWTVKVNQIGRFEGFMSSNSETSELGQRTLTTVIAFLLAIKEWPTYQGGCGHTWDIIL